MSCCSFMAELRDDASSGLGDSPIKLEPFRRLHRWETARFRGSSSRHPREGRERQHLSLRSPGGRWLQGQQERQWWNTKPQGRKGLQQLPAIASSIVPPLPLTWDMVKGIRMRIIHLQAQISSLRTNPSAHALVSRPQPSSSAL